MQVGDLVKNKFADSIGIIVTHLVGYEDAYCVEWNNGANTWETQRSLEVICK